nr:family 16 glycoside hydrolase [Halalkalibacter urbisdiaboli]
MERLDRGVIAVKTDEGVYVGWRLLGTDPKDISFNLYRNNEKINEAPITSSTNFLDTEGNENSSYFVRAIVNGEEQSPSEAVSVWAQNYMDIPLQKPKVETDDEIEEIPENITGKIGMGSWATQVEYDDVKVTSNGETLFADDFSDGSTDEWDVFNGTWVEEDGVYKQTSNDTEVWASAGSVDWSDYTLELRAKKNDGSEGMLILFGVQDSDNYYWLNLGGWGNSQHAIQKATKGARTVVSETVPGSIETGRWYDIKIEVSDRHIRTYLDGELLHEMEDIVIPPPPLDYFANDASVGDLDGDGEYEIVLKWEPNNAKDNSQPGMTDEVFIDAYKLDGTLLWRIGLGKNIRAGAHYTQFMVYDLDGDGKAEVAMKTADGTVDGAGKVIGDPNADYRNEGGYILDGPEYLTVFDGETGKALDTVDYDPPRGDACDWGDCYGNRVDRFLAGIAYLDGERPSLVMSRGYYTRTVLAAYNFRDGELTKLWTFDSDEPGNEGYAGQGNHSLSVGDVDGDGKDEVIFGAMAVDDDGTGLYTTGWGHGDANHLSDLDPNRPGLEFFQAHEWGQYGATLRDAATGELIWGVVTNKDTGRGMAADIDPRYEGAEMWAAIPPTKGPDDRATGVRSASGEVITDAMPSSINYGIWWDGDLLRELLDHNWVDWGIEAEGTISKWDYENNETVNLLTAEGAFSNNSSKGNPTLQADILGDWREEVIWRVGDSDALRLYTTTDFTEHRIYTLMHDPIYRLSIAWQNSGYNQPPHTGFFLGHDMKEPPIPSIYLGEKINASVNITPETLNLNSNGGDHSLQVIIDVGMATAEPTNNVQLNVNGSTILATRVSNTNNKIHAMFDRQEVIQAIKSQNGGVFEVEARAYLDNGSVLIGSDSLNVIN